MLKIYLAYKNWDNLFQQVPSFIKFATLYTKEIYTHVIPIWMLYKEYQCKICYAYVNGCNSSSKQPS